jgi:sulfur dioxygenase
MLDISYPRFQLFDRDSCTYTYLLADTSTMEAVLIDPVIDLANRDKQVLQDLGLKLKYASK